MQAAKRYLLIALTFTLALTTLVVLSPRAARAANNMVQAVLVTNTSANPVPTTAVGTTNVSGTVGISGNVSVVNTPNVNVTGFPNLVTVKSVDEKGRNPYMQGAFANCASGTSAFCDMVYPAVPANKRLVIEHVSANIGANTGVGVNGTFLLAGGVVFSLPGQAMATPELIGVNQSVVAYVEPGQAFTYRVVWNSTSGTGAVSSTVSGYLVDLTQ